MPAPSSVAPAPIPVLSAGAAAHAAGVVTDLVHDVSLRMLGDEAGAARATSEVLLRAVGRAADGDHRAWSDAALLRAAVRHADALRSSGTVVPTLDGPGPLTRTVRRDGRGQDRAAVAVSALHLDLDALVTLDLQMRHRFDDRTVAAVLDRPRAEIAEIRDAAITRVARQTGLTADDARDLYASLTVLPAPDEVHATVAAAAARNPATTAAGARPLIAWAIAALVIVATLVGLADLVTGWDRPADGELQVAVATALVGDTLGADVELTQTSASGQGDRDTARPSVTSPATGTVTDADDEVVSIPTDGATADEDSSLSPEPDSDEDTTDEPAQDADAPDAGTSDGGSSTPEPREPTVGALDPLLPGA